MASRPTAPQVRIQRWQSGVWAESPDAVATEEPLQLMLDGKDLSVVMRTPGDDIALALGLLFAEGVIRSREDIASIEISAEAREDSGVVRVNPSLVESNRIDVRLRVAPRRRQERSMLSSSACGVCGAVMIEDLRRDLSPLADGPRVDPALLAPMVDRLRSAQGVFEKTGGLHAAGLFDVAGTPLAVREDIGRHNAIDKLVGGLLLDGGLPASQCVLVVSGRAGYEIVQKSITAGIPVLAAVGAPSSLAVSLAREFNQTLVGFLRGDRFNVYAAPSRLQTA